MRFFPTYIFMSLIILPALSQTPTSQTTAISAPQKTQPQTLAPNTTAPPLEKTNTPPPTQTPQEQLFRTLSVTDALGRTRQITFLDQKGNPTTEGRISKVITALTLNANNFCGIRFSYNSDHPDAKPILWSFTNEKGEVMTTSQGFAHISFLFNDQGQDLKTTYLDINNNPTDNSLGFASIVKEYDGTHRLIKEYYLDQNDKLTYNKVQGYAIKLTSYINTNTSELKITEFKDAQSNPITNKGAFRHASGKTKGKDPLIILQSYNDINDGLMNSTDGYALHLQRDLSDNKNPKEAYLDQNNTPVNGPQGFATLELKRDKKTNTYTLKHLDNKHHLVDNKELGWAYMTYTLDDNKKQQNKLYYNSKKELVVPKK